jgi:diguanylate cyclase (GGDEF)-like protein
VLAALLVVVIFDPHTAIFSPVINVGVILLAIMSLGAACARARAGSPQGWFFLLGWGSLTVVGIIRAGYFLQLQGTPDWLEIAHPASQVFGALVLVRYAEREMHVARTVARIDPLTLLPNRAELDRGLETLLRQAQQDGLPACVMFVDLDHFKSINDRFGHGVGDICLTAMGRILRHHVRASDLIARYGGEEFVLALEGAGRERAATVAEALRAAVQEQGRELEGYCVELTASIGVSDYRAGDRPADLLARADAALYRAKHEGRNRVVLDFAQVP